MYITYHRIKEAVLSKCANYSLLLAVVLFFSLAVSACSLRSPISDVDQSLLNLGVNGEVCWEDLCPGVSTESDVISKLTELSFVTPNSFQFHEDSWLDTETSSRVTWDCQEPRHRWCGNALFSNDVLHYISLGLNRSISIGQFVNLYGRPDNVVYIDDPWSTACQLQLIWIDRGIIVDSNALKACSDLISQSSSMGLSSAFKIRSFSLSSEMAMSDILDDQELVSYPWSGISDSSLSNIQIIPGNYSMWAISIISFIIVPIIGILKPNIKSAFIAFPIAGFTTFGPTLAFQFSDICVPTIVSWIVNTTLLGFLYMGMIEGARLIRSHFKSHQT